MSEKTEDARKVLVLGDFVAGGLAERAGGRLRGECRGHRRFADQRFNPASSVTNFFNWPESITGFLEEEEPDVVINHDWGQ